MSINLNSIPSKPDPLPDDATDVQRLQHQDDMQAYWFAVNSAQNQQNQEAMTRSNMQKAEHDAMMEVARNLK